ncbi:1-acyl-sn-glycerol-3-phosphate acyltransferase [Candidatus Saccharibacteria bacterium]|nr:1-acyl-sn-glycerol-3-phosphate acyltransferase [Candidatus Saccharibacteria bacterium]
MPRKELQEVDLWLPDFYTLTPEELFEIQPGETEPVISISERLPRLTRAIGGYVLPKFNAGISAQAREVLSGPAVIASNHLDFTDILVLALGMRKAGLKEPYFLAMAELFDSRFPVVADYFTSWGGIPLDRARLSSGKGMKHLLEMTDYVLNELGHPLVIFPEGGIYPKDKKYPHRIENTVSRTPLMIAKNSDVPLVVAGIFGTRMALLKSIFGLTNRVGLSLMDVFTPDEVEKVRKRKDVPFAPEMAMRIAMQRAADRAKVLSVCEPGLELSSRTFRIATDPIM